MVIAIVGPLSFPHKEKLAEFVTFNKKGIVANFHPHPWIYNLAIGLAESSSNEVHVICTSIYVNNDVIFEYEKVNFHVLTAYNSFLNYPLLFFPDIIKISLRLKKINPDIVHGQHRSFHAMPAILFTKNHIITNHGDVIRHFKSIIKNRPLKGVMEFRFYKLLYSIFYQNIVDKLAKNVIAVSKDCISTNNVRTKHFIIHNAINSIFYTFNWRKPKKDNIIFVGTLTNLKRPHLLLEYLTINKEVTLNLVCQIDLSDDYNKMIQEYVYENNLNHRVNFLGFLDPKKLAKAMSQSSVLCLPSSYESFGMVLAESMAVGCPVLATNIGGIPEVISNGKTGLLFTKNDKDDLFNKLDKIINDTEFANTISSNGKNVARSKWHNISVAKRTLSVYNEIIKKETY